MGLKEMAGAGRFIIVITENTGKANSLKSQPIIRLGFFYRCLVSDRSVFASVASPSPE